MASEMALIEAAIPALRRYAGALLCNRQDVDDLVHDCLVQASTGCTLAEATQACGPGCSPSCTTLLTHTVPSRQEDQDCESP